DELEVEELFVTTSVADLEHVRQTTEHGRTVRTAFLPELGHVRADQLQVQDVGALPLLRPIDTSTAALYGVGKRILDVVVSAAALLVLAPLWLLIVLAIKLDAKGPAIFTQIRVGRRGKPCTFYKFRTLRIDADPYSKSHSVVDSRAARV